MKLCTNCNKEITSGRVICKECYTQLDEWKDKAKRYDELTKTPTIEKVKKEWEEAGYLCHELKSSFYIMKNNKFKPKIVYINKRLKSVNFYVVADLILLNRLTKTLKALEIEND